MQPTVHTAFTSGPLSWFEQATTNMRSCLKGTMLMILRGHASAQALQPMHFS